MNPGTGIDRSRQTGRMGPPGESVTDDDARRLDGVAEQLQAAGTADTETESRLLSRYRSDNGLHPGAVVLQASPFGQEMAEIELT